MSSAWSKQDRSSGSRTSPIPTTSAFRWRAPRPCGSPNCTGRARVGNGIAHVCRGFLSFPWAGTPFTLAGEPLYEALPAIRGPGGNLARRCGRIAQLVEQLTLNQRVLGSSPSASTIFLPIKSNTYRLVTPKSA